MSEEPLSDAVITMVNSSGLQISKTKIQSIPSMVSIPINIIGMVKGVYFVKIVSGTKVDYFRIFKF